ncbi:hypothetical protein C8R44DRAFT_846943 [Mycena epipterygia]|nr:hypothetical protein C8R44DRAFT_846943 [Mycena epipterygia]
MALRATITAVVRAKPTTTCAPLHNGDVPVATNQEKHVGKKNQPGLIHPNTGWLGREYWGDEIWIANHKYGEPQFADAIERAEKSRAGGGDGDGDGDGDRGWNGRTSASLAQSNGPSGIVGTGVVDRARRGGVDGRITSGAATASDSMSISDQIKIKCQSRVVSGGVREGSRVLCARMLECSNARCSDARMRDARSAQKTGNARGRKNEEKAAVVDLVRSELGSDPTPITTMECATPSR